MTPLPTVHLLTCPERAGVLAGTLRSWAECDWGVMPVVYRDAGGRRGAGKWGSPARVGRVVGAYEDWLRAVLAGPGRPEEWVLLLEDDVEVHPRLGSLVSSWEALEDPRCVMASLFNASVQTTDRWGPMPRAVAARPEFFLGTQALLLRRGAVARALAGWERVPGLQSQRLAALLGPEGPIWVHRPSLVQHVAMDSSWGARITRALDYDPRWGG